MKPRVVYWNNVPAPYTVERFNALLSEKTAISKVVLDAN